MGHHIFFKWITLKYNNHKCLVKNRTLADLGRFLKVRIAYPKSLGRISDLCLLAISSETQRFDSLCFPWETPQTVARFHLWFFFLMLSNSDVDFQFPLTVLRSDGRSPLLSSLLHCIWLLQDTGVIQRAGMSPDNAILSAGISRSAKGKYSFSVSHWREIPKPDTEESHLRALNSASYSCGPVKRMAALLSSPCLKHREGNSWGFERQGSAEIRAASWLAHE